MVVALIILFAQACLFAVIREPVAMAVSQIGCLYCLDKLGFLR